MLGLKLDRMADSVSGQTVVDPKVGCSGAGQWLAHTGSLACRLTCSSSLEKLDAEMRGVSCCLQGYLTDLKSIKISTDAEVADIKKARHLLKSIVQSNPRHAPGWIAAAR